MVWRKSVVNFEESKNKNRFYFYPNISFKDPFLPYSSKVKASGNKCYFPEISLSTRL